MSKPKRLYNTFTGEVQIQPRSKPTKRLDLGCTLCWYQYGLTRQATRILMDNRSRAGHTWAVCDEHVSDVENSCVYGAVELNYTQLTATTIADLRRRAGLSYG